MSPTAGRAGAPLEEREYAGGVARARGSGGPAAPTVAAVTEAAVRPVTIAPPAGPGSALRRLPRTSMYLRVVVLNAAILVAATALLIFTPATVSFPVGIDQALILAGGLVLLVVTNAVLVRFSFRGLEALAKRMETLDVLRPRERLPAMGGIETRTLIDGFNTMLTRVEDERRRSARIAFSALEGERRRVGQELHDEIGQRLTGILLQLGRIADDTPLGLRARLVAIQEEVRATLDEVGGLAWQLRPGILDDLGLLSALEALVQTLGERSDTRVELSLPVGARSGLRRRSSSPCTGSPRRACTMRSGMPAPAASASCFARGSAGSSSRSSTTVAASGAWRPKGPGCAECASGRC